MARKSIPKFPGRARSRSRSATAAEHSAASDIVGLRAISEDVIYPHVFANADREVGGVLVGRMSADGGLPLVTGAIPALSADERRATLTFTQDAWAHVHQVLDRDFPPDEQIVGWYHSHPGFGIFLSGHDLFIHENFFAAPSQIAVVVDPTGRTEGAFAWRAGKLSTLFERSTPTGWTAAAAVGPGSGDARGDASPPPARRGDHENSMNSAIALIVAGLIGVLAGFGLWNALDGGSSTNPTSRTPRGEGITHHRGVTHEGVASSTTQGIEVLP